MLLATNRGSGQNMGFPDTCNTPAGPATVPIPYPNIAMHAQANPYSQLVKVSGVNALNMASLISKTSGDEAGTAHPMFMQMANFSMGNPLVYVELLPAINLTSLSAGNNMNCPAASVTVPSVTTVFYTMQLEGSSPQPRDGSGPCAATGEPPAGAAGGGYTRALDAPAIDQLAATMAEPEVTACWLDDGVALLRVGAFSAAVPTLVYRALRRLGPTEPRALVIDLRGNPGGDTEAMVRLADDFLPQDTVILRRQDADGDEILYRARHGESYACALLLLVDGGTASAAELFAGCLQCHRRAKVVGKRTFGKGAMQRVVPVADGSGTVYADVAGCRLPSDTAVEGRGIEPDVVVTATEVGDAPLETARRLARAAEA
jgi:carboxyl-terminal processing protease